MILDFKYAKILLKRSDLMKKDEFKKLEEKYIELFKERPWILKFLDISDSEKLRLLKEAVRNKRRIEL